MRSADSCLAVLPEHVVDEAKEAGLSAEDGAATGELREVVRLGNDIAYGRVYGAATRHCGLPVGTQFRDVSKVLGTGGQGSLRALNGDGSIARVPVTVIDDDGERFLRIKPSHERDHLRKGQSGALLVVDNRPLGMLQSVHVRTGVGTVIRVDQMLASISRDLNVRREPSATTGAPAGPGAAQDWRVVGWSAGARSSEESALNLTAPGNDGGWRAPVDKWPVVVELESSSGIQTISWLNVVSDVSSRNNATPPASVQISTALDSSGLRWRSIGTYELVYAEDGNAHVSVAPTRALQIRLHFYAARPAAEIALRRIRAGR